MDEAQLFTISEQIASIARAAISDKAGYIMITASTDGNGDAIHMYSNLDPNVIIAMFAALAQDITGQTNDTAIH